jgi:hypothetical protein
VAGVSYLAVTHLGLDVHKDTISVAILVPDRDGPAVDRIPMTSRRSAGWLAALGIPAGCEPAMRPARPALSWPGCWTASGFAVR